MKTVILTFCLVAGAFSVQQHQIQREGPICPIPDPLGIEGPVAINISADPVLKLVQGSQITNLTANGLTTLYYTINMDRNLTIFFEIFLSHADGFADFSAEGYLDARPFRPETIPSGNLTGSGLGKLSTDNLHIKGRAPVRLNLIGNNFSLNELILEDISFRTFSIDLGTNFTVDGRTIDWEELNLNLKNNFDSDFAANETAIAENIRLVVNAFVRKYTIADLLDFFEGEAGEDCSPEEKRSIA